MRTVRSAAFGLLVLASANSAVAQAAPQPTLQNGSVVQVWVDMPIIFRPY